MAGGSKDDGLRATNIFAALDTRRRRKKGDKEQSSSKNGGGAAASAAAGRKGQEEQVFWPAPARLTVKSWADVDDDDEDDYYATTAPPQLAWGAAEREDVQKESSTHVEVTCPIQRKDFYDWWMSFECESSSFWNLFGLN